ncbi:RNA polymerase sigma factor [Flavivirga spongiicola]|uniref:RNA polymerase sigma-70 factor n=1 Tax=Flavivirga spongiicola TaxID=421621 RepID=A0ABU7XND7_9FLAO|nr:RNA polymerase sigma-70 factor [Flavivirga sp. MEBiC05379]MDO5981924.1 RNA polymerase sigma-70 factor [Flavivirga sp. MEBiC05379]
MSFNLHSKDIIIAVKNGNHDAYSHLYRTYYDKLCKYIYSLTLDYKQAEDVVQDTLIDIWVKRDKLNINSSLNNYLYRSVYNKFINLSKKNIRKQLLLNELHMEAIVELEGLGEDRKEARLIAIEKIIEQLPPKRKEIFILSKLKNYKYKEIAVMRNVSVSTVESQIRKAMITIRKEMLLLILTGMTIMVFMLIP